MSAGASVVVGLAVVSVGEEIVESVDDVLGVDDAVVVVWSVCRTLPGPAERRIASFRW